LTVDELCINSFTAELISLSQRDATCVTGDRRRLNRGCSACSLCEFVKERVRRTLVELMSEVCACCHCDGGIVDTSHQAYSWS